MTRLGRDRLALPLEKKQKIDVSQWNNTKICGHKENNQPNLKIMKKKEIIMPNEACF